MRTSLPLTASRSSGGSTGAALTRFVAGRSTRSCLLFASCTRVCCQSERTSASSELAPSAPPPPPQPLPRIAAVDSPAPRFPRARLRPHRALCRKRSTSDPTPTRPSLGRFSFARTEPGQAAPQKSANEPGRGARPDIMALRLRRRERRHPARGCRELLLAYTFKASGKNVQVVPSRWALVL